MGSRLNDFDQFVTASGRSALVKIVGAKGSTPREVSAWMLVGADRIFETIGGGQLEFDAIDKARNLLGLKSEKTEKITIPLGPETGQCCGGTVSLQIKFADRQSIAILRRKVQKEEQNQPAVYVFGAGHVGVALAEALALLPVSTILTDTRETQLQAASVPVEKRLTAIPEEEIREAPPNSAFVILTHDHALDFLIAREALARDDAAYVGMIGSKTKRAAFRNWLKRENGTDAGFENLTCPIGCSDITDKRPQIIAALVAAEIIKALSGSNAGLEEHSSGVAVEAM